MLHAHSSTVECTGAFKLKAKIKVMSFKCDVFGNHMFLKRFQGSGDPRERGVFQAKISSPKSNSIAESHSEGMGRPQMLARLRISSWRTRLMLLLVLLLALCQNAGSRKPTKGAVGRWWQSMTEPCPISLQPIR
jgi:hypothetical protein